MPRFSLAFGMARHILPDAAINILHIGKSAGFDAFHIMRLFLGLDLRTTHKNLKCKNKNVKFRCPATRNLFKYIAKRYLNFYFFILQF